MSFIGHISAGQVILDQPISLPDGTQVRVELIESSPKSTDAKQTMLERYRHVIGTVEMPADSAAQHDHYLYGTPKR